MHYAFDTWMVREFSDCPFERYADDAVVHCKCRRQAELVLAGIAARMGEVGLRLHPDKTRIVYWKCAARRPVVSPAQPGGTRRKVLGSNGLPGSER
jgi:RNA-directed DNA polymerase